MEPERKIEKLLRAFANKRRSQAGEPMELPPTVRQELQREVARRGSAKEAGGFFSGILSGLRPKLAFGVCFVAVGVALFFTLKPFLGRKPNTLAMNSLGGRESTLAANRRAEPALSPAPPAPLSPAQDNFDAGANRDRSLSGSAKVPPVSNDREKERAIVAGTQPSAPEGTAIAGSAAQPGSVVSPAPALESPATIADFKSDSLGLAMNTNARDKIAETPPPAMAAVPPPAVFDSPIIASTPQPQNRPVTNGETLAFAGGGVSALMTKDEASSASSVSHQFYRVTSQNMLRTDAAAEVSPSVLNAFRVEQNGLDIKVIDSDGSTYAGTLQPVSNQKKPLSSASPALQAPVGSLRAAKTSPRQQTITNYFFRVSGTNHSLNQNIVFTGNLIPWVATTRTVAKTPSAGAGFGGVAGLVPSPSILSISNAQILGRVKIGDRTETDLNALPDP